LRILTSSSQIDEIKILKIIREIDRLNLLSTLEIIQILSRNQQITLGLIKDFIVEKITVEKEFIDKVFLKD
jgi:hypothetical protein